MTFRLTQQPRAEGDPTSPDSQGRIWYEDAYGGLIRPGENNSSGGGAVYFGPQPPADTAFEAGAVFIQDTTFQSYVFDGAAWVETLGRSAEGTGGVDSEVIADIENTLNPFIAFREASITGETTLVYRIKKPADTYWQTGVDFKCNLLGYYASRVDVDIAGDGTWVDYDNLDSAIKKDICFGRGGSGETLALSVRPNHDGFDINDPNTYPQPGYEDTLIRYWAKNVINDREKLQLCDPVSPWVINHIKYTDVYPGVKTSAKKSPPNQGSSPGS